MMGVVLAVVLLLLAGIAFVVNGRKASPEEQLRSLGGDERGTDRLIEAEMKRTRGISRQEAASRVLRELRRDR